MKNDLFDVCSLPEFDEARKKGIWENVNQFHASLVNGWETMDIARETVQ